MANTNTLPHPGRFDDLLTILADSERRAIVTYLQDAETDTASLDSLASALASATSLERDDARMRLHHTHLPKLAGTPLLDYDPDTARVEYHGDRDLEALLNAIRTFETSRETE